MYLSAANVKNQLFHSFLSLHHWETIWRAERRTKSMRKLNKLYGAAVSYGKKVFTMLMALFALVIWNYH